MIPDWYEDALCSQVGGDLWFVEKGGDTRPAVRVCKQCVVRAECLDLAVQNEERYGIWGALTERKRRRLLGLAAKDAA